MAIITNTLSLDEEQHERQPPQQQGHHNNGTNIQQQQHPEQLVADEINNHPNNNNNILQPPTIRIKNCFCCPYGGNASIATVFGGIALLFSFIACYGCSLFQVGGPGSPLFGTIAYYYYDDKGGMDAALCESFIAVPPPGSKDRIDNLWRLGRAASTILIFFGVSNFVNICILSCCVRLTPSYIKTVAYLAFFTGLFHPILFIGMMSSLCDYYNCQFSSGSILVLCSMIAWFITAFVLSYAIKPRTTQNDLLVQEQWQQYTQQLELIQQQYNQQQQLLQQQQQFSFVEQPQAQGVIHAVPVDTQQQQQQQQLSNGGQVSIEIVETPNMNGTMSRTTTTTTTNPDGSKTIQITTENNILCSTTNNNIASTTADGNIIPTATIAQLDTIPSSASTTASFANANHSSAAAAAAAPNRASNPSAKYNP